MGDDRDMSTASSILDKIRDAGGSVSLVNSRVSVNIPVGTLNQEDRDLLAKSRDEIVALLDPVSVSETPHPLERWFMEQDWTKWRHEGRRWIGPDSVEDLEDRAARLREQTGLLPRELDQRPWRGLLGRRS